MFESLSRWLHSPSVILVFRGLVIPLLFGWMVSHLYTLSSERISLQSPAALGFGLLLIELSVLAAGARLNRAFATLGLELPLSRSIRIHVESSFYFLLLPMGIGVEVSRYAKCKPELPQANAIHLTSALILDRLFAVGAAAIAALPFLWIWLIQGPTQAGRGEWPLSLAIGGLILVITMLGAAYMLRAHLLPHWRSLQHYSASHARHGLSATALSLVAHVTFLAGVAYIAKAIGIMIDLTTVVGVGSLGVVANAVPLSLAGIGPGELISVWLYESSQTPLAMATTLVLLTYMMRVFCALQGGLLEMRRGMVQVREVLATARGRGTNRPGPDHIH